MLTKNEILDFLKTNKEIFEKKFYLKKIGIFGSFARDEQKEGSDIDIIIERESGVKNIFDLDWDLEVMLSSRFNRKVDICTEKYIKPYAKKYVLKDAIYV